MVNHNRESRYQADCKICVIGIKSRMITMAICKDCKSSVDIMVKTAFKLGMDEAHRRLTPKINLLMKTHNHMLHEIIGFEIDDPVYGIKISASLVNDIIELLAEGKRRKSRRVIRQLKKLLESENYKALEKLKDYVVNA